VRGVTLYRSNLNPTLSSTLVGSLLIDVKGESMSVVLSVVYMDTE